MVLAVGDVEEVGEPVDEVGGDLQGVEGALADVGDGGVGGRVGEEAGVGEDLADVVVAGDQVHGGSAHHGAHEGGGRLAQAGVGAVGVGDDLGGEQVDVPAARLSPSGSPSGPPGRAGAGPAGGSARGPAGQPAAGPAVLAGFSAVAVMGLSFCSGLLLSLGSATAR